MCPVVPLDSVNCEDTELDGVIEDILALAEASQAKVVLQIGGLATSIAPGESPLDISNRYRERKLQVVEMKVLDERRRNSRREYIRDDGSERRKFVTPLRP